MQKQAGTSGARLPEISCPSALTSWVDSGNCLAHFKPLSGIYAKRSLEISEHLCLQVPLLSLTVILVGVAILSGVFVLEDQVFCF